jgi:hypothetical protein
VPRQPSPFQQFCPPELTAAAGPLAATSAVLRALCEDARGVAALAGGSPSPLVQDALAGFLDAWAGSLFDLAGEAGSLATNLKAAALDYAGTEQALHDRAMAMSGRTRR